ncbi:cobaltochelatase subunit CobN [uncultured Phascolarctobacterium sp.]|uniref:cobaltochelatase subunit CobN n=1 Tax=uncultured Phascolarctobacterium sp. TaxID=512296 RepID=UPI0025F6A5DD|nr:cobaltochelatase subunit CobN [uncultured Phascolarctobacterium sp.]
MAGILFITNMEAHRVGILSALEVLDSYAGNNLAVEQISDNEIWNNQWKKRIINSDFVLCTWMGTGLSCDYLKKASAFMQNCQIKHLFDIIDPGTDKMAGGVDAIIIENIKQYLACGGLANYKNLCLYLLNTFEGTTYEYDMPRQLPWNGVFYPGEKAYTNISEYIEKHWCNGRPTIGFIFAREDWLWDRLAYQTEIIKAIEAESCNVIAVFTTTLENAKTGAVSLGQSFKEFFYKNNEVIIDALVNPFVFSLTITGFAKLQDLQNLGVPVFQIYNVYMPYQWWEKNMIGLTANEVSYAVAMPEFDGVIHSVPVSTNEELNNGTHYRRPLVERINMLARKVCKWARLKHKPNNKKKIALVFHNYPPTNSNIGSAACLDSIESVRLLLKYMQQNGYLVDNIPANSQEFIDEITKHATNDRRFISEALIEGADGKLTKLAYDAFFEKLPINVQEQLTKDWGRAPGEVFRYDDILIVPGMLNGNIFITVQPPRGFGDDPGKIYHSPDCAPTHHYLGFYHWLRDIWGADAMIHFGTHGNLEWLPGKGNAMSAGCYPDICTGDMPNIYPYWITCVGEGIQAKRRSAACLISYLSAPMSSAGVYEELADLEQLLDEYCQFKNDSSFQNNLADIREMIRAKVSECNLDDEVQESAFVGFDEYIGKLHTYITDIKNMQIKTGLHIFGVPPSGEDLAAYVLALTNVENGKMPSLIKLLANVYRYDYYELLENSSCILPDGSMTYGMFLDKLREKAITIIKLLQEHDFDVACIEQIFDLAGLHEVSGKMRQQFTELLQYICRNIVPNLLQTSLEVENTLHALDGCYIDPCASGAPTSGGADLLPTGRNFYSVDPRTLPTKVAWEIGQQMAKDVINRFICEEGRYPESVGIILWATSNLRNHGQCVAEFLYLMGLKPVWQTGSQRVVGLEVIPLNELKRPRIDVTGRISGLFRDSMPASVTWLDEAVRMVAALDEPFELNFVKKHVLTEQEELMENGMDAATALKNASFRIFGDPPGAHGAGIGEALEAKNWQNVDDLAAVYTRWGAYVYGAKAEGEYLPERFQKRMSQIDITVQNVDHRESSMLSGDDYNNYRGGMVAAVRSYKGSMPKNYVSDSSDKCKIQLRSLDEELKRWFRGEAMNPKYIEGMKKHGYKGAGDLATYVAVSYQWDATSEIMEDWMYEQYAKKYALDLEMQRWMQKVNPWALYRITEVLLEAEQRGMWAANKQTKEELQQLFLSMEGELEERGEES